MRVPGTQKLKCIRADHSLRQALATALREAGFPDEIAMKIADWDPYDQNASADWFEPEYMFGARDGFDIAELATGEQRRLAPRQTFFPEATVSSSSTEDYANPTIRLDRICYISVGMVAHAHERAPAEGGRGAARDPASGGGVDRTAGAAAPMLTPSPYCKTWLDRVAESGRGFRRGS